METRYVAYGLALHASFQLPGMVQRAGAHHPSLALDVISPAQIQRLWSGADGVPVWQGRLGDGRSLTIERGIAGDLLITDAARARFHLDPGRESLRCAPLRGGLDWQRTLLSKVLSSISLLHGYEALHASAVESPEGAIAILAPAGSGKTTLALELMRRSYRLMSDDVLTLAATPEGVSAFPGTPHMNVGSGNDGCTSIPQASVTLGDADGERWIAVPNAACDARRLVSIVLLQRGPGLALQLQILRQGPLELAPYMLGLLDDSARPRRRFELYGDLSATATLMRVTAGPADSPAAIADLILSSSATRPKREAVGVGS
jgi:hypothetical protein